MQLHRICLYTIPKEDKEFNCSHSEEILVKNKTETKKAYHKFCISVSKIKGLRWHYPSNFAVYNKFAFSGQDQNSVYNSLLYIYHGSSIFTIPGLHSNPGFIFTPSLNILSGTPCWQFPGKSQLLTMEEDYTSHSFLYPPWLQSQNHMAKETIFWVFFLFFFFKLQDQLGRAVSYSSLYFMSTFLLLHKTRLQH